MFGKLVSEMVEDESSNMWHRSKRGERGGGSSGNLIAPEGRRKQLNIHLGNAWAPSCAPAFRSRLKVEVENRY